MILLNAVNDSNITVGIESTSSTRLAGAPLIGGAFGGSTKNNDGSVTTKQYINSDQTAVIDEFYGMPAGTTALHEVMESYIGGQDSPGAKMPYVMTGEAYDNYKDAHDKAAEADPDYVQPIVEREREDPQSPHDIVSPAHYDPNTGMVPERRKRIVD